MSDIRSCTKLDVLRRFLTIHNLNGRKDKYLSACTLVSEIVTDTGNLNLFHKQEYYLRKYILKLYEGFRKAKINFKPNSLKQTKQVTTFCGKLSHQFSCTQEFECALQKPKSKRCIDIEIAAEEMEENYDDECKDPDWKIAKEKMSKFVFISPKISRLLDSLGISSNSMARLFVQLKRLNNVEANTSCSYILKNRNKERQDAMKRLQEFEFPNSLILHWDGKRMENNNHEMVERLVISVSASNGLQKLISCNFIENGSAKTIANELKKQCDQLDITKKIVGLSYDTTAANSGVKGGAALLFEKSITVEGKQKHLNRRPCRLHQKELCVSNPFKEVVMKTVGAGIPIFSQFRKWFRCNNKLKITPAIFSKRAKPILEKNLQALIDFYVKQTNINHRRADHLEVAELALVHLNANPHYKLKACGADHHARWLSKVIYIFKIMLFKDHFELSETLVEKFEAMLIYFITIYLKQWFTCESTIHAPKNDLDFLKELDEFSKINGTYFSIIAKNVQSTQLRHMDYISEENAIFSIFDERISLQEKEKLRVKLLGKNSHEQFLKLSTIDPDVSYSSADLVEEVSQNDKIRTDGENTLDLAELIDTTDKILFEKKFIPVEENEEPMNNIDSETNKLKYLDSVVSKSPFDFITLESLRTLYFYGINVSFMLSHSSEWTSQKCFINATEKAKNIQSTSIYTEQLVGRISRLNNSCLVKNKDELNCLALCAVEKEDTC